MLAPAPIKQMFIAGNTKIYPYPWS